MDDGITKGHPYDELKVSRGWLERAHGLGVSSCISRSQTTSTCHNKVLHSYINHISFSIMHIISKTSLKESHHNPPKSTALY